jgi:hypothetical protein
MNNPSLSERIAKLSWDKYDWALSRCGDWMEMMEQEHWPLHLKHKLLDFVNKNVHEVSQAGYDLATRRHNNLLRLPRGFDPDIAWPTSVYEPDTSWSGFPNSYDQEAAHERWVSINDLPEPEIWQHSWGAFSRHEHDTSDDDDTNMSEQ